MHFNRIKKFWRGEKTLFAVIILLGVACTLPVFFFVAYHYGWQLFFTYALDTNSDYEYWRETYRALRWNMLLVSLLYYGALFMLAIPVIFRTLRRKSWHAWLALPTAFAPLILYALVIMTILPYPQRHFLPAVFLRLSGTEADAL